jgi:hypothetical protein
MAGGGRSGHAGGSYGCGRWQLNPAQQSKTTAQKGPFCVIQVVLYEAKPTRAKVFMVDALVTAVSDHAATARSGTGMPIALIWRATTRWALPDERKLACRPLYVPIFFSYHSREPKA